MTAPALPSAPGPVDLDAAVEAGCAAAWRTAVLALRYDERRRVFPTAVHVGHPDGASSTHEQPAHRRRDDPGLDRALRCDLVAALVDHHTGSAGTGTTPLVWVTRSGPLGGHDEDAAWLGAAATAYQEAGLVLTLAVVTHAGWYDPRTGVGRSWKRLRRR